MLYQYISTSPDPTTIMAFNINSRSLTIFFPQDMLTQIAVQGLIQYVIQSQDFKDLGFAQNYAITTLGNKDIHKLTHACKDLLKKASHIHIVFNKSVNPALVDLLLDSMKTLQNSVELRSNFKVSPPPSILETMINSVANYFFEDTTTAKAEAKVQFNPADSITYLSDQDLEAIRSEFTGGYEISRNILTRKQAAKKFPDEQLPDHPYRHFVDFQAKGCLTYYPQTLQPWQKQEIAAREIMFENDNALKNNFQYAAAGAVLCCFAYSLYKCYSSDDSQREKHSHKKKQ